jgi:hypothetical protein
MTSVARMNASATSYAWVRRVTADAIAKLPIRSDPAENPSWLVGVSPVVRGVMNAHHASEALARVTLFERTHVVGISKRKVV